MLPIILILNHIDQKKVFLDNLDPKQTIEIYPDNNTIKIDNIRELKKQIPLLQPNSTRVIINNFDLATIYAQNSSLKLLEETSNKVEFILTAENLNNILPTVQSRCKIKDLRNRKLIQSDAKTATWNNFAIKNKVEAVEKINELLNLSFKSLKDNYTMEKANFIHLLLKTKYLMEENNLNPQITVDYLLINAKNSNIIK
ncbi:MAG: hypothetical protein KatS3mg090_0912 [Patescibacteria group bacterium]|nr:MAG: hypothetical protein KatS3mg090_0912 [Patescibacteria group bacterium]